MFPMNTLQRSFSPGRAPALQPVYRLIALLPLTWLVLFALLTLAVTWQQGHVPGYGNPDPKDTGVLVALYYPVITLLPVVVASIPMGLALTLMALWSRFLLRLERQTTILYLLGALLFVLLVTVEPLGLLTWLGD
jgi:hypothetical protein